MHDIDQTQQFIDGLETDELEPEQVGDLEGPFTEQEVADIASEMLTVGSEGELEYFLGGLIKKGMKAARKFVKSPTGKAIVGVLRQVAKKALPALASSLGNTLLPGVGGVIGDKLGSAVAGSLELEQDGSEMEFETAKQLVRTAGAAVVHAAGAPDNAPPVQVAREAVASALKKYAPAIVGGATPRAGGRWGRWVRRGNRIILFGV